jgi:uncharacterized protein (UPF0335 family)
MAPKAKTPSLDAAIKSLFRDYGLATRKDLDKLQTKIARLEKTVKDMSNKQAIVARSSRGAKSSGARRLSATNVVLDAVKRSKKGADFGLLQKRTGFDEKKLRNIIFRLHKLDKIKRVRRGVYIAT